MRAWIFAVLVMVASPAFAAGKCIYANQHDQTVDWSGGDTVVFDPLYADHVTCKLIPKPDNPNYFSADCGSYMDTLVIGTSTRERKNADIVVWGGVFYWLKCDKDHA